MHSIQLDDLATGQIICMACGNLFAVSSWRPRLRCPACNALGYPDRAQMHLLPLQWECAHCHAINSGKTNFCLSCANGLASRCHRCEAPVYSVVCTLCGHNQASLLQTAQIEEQREAWIPIIKSRVYQQQAIAEGGIPRHDAHYGVAGWRSIMPGDTQQTEDLSQTATGGRRIRTHVFAGWAIVLLGLVMIFWEASSESPFVQQLVDSLSAWVSTLPTYLDVVMSDLQAILQYSTNITPGNPEFSILLATGVIAVTTFPLVLYLAVYLVRSLLP